MYTSRESVLQIRNVQLVTQRELGGALRPPVCKSLVGDGEWIPQKVYYYIREAFTTRKITFDYVYIASSI